MADDKVRFELELRMVVIECFDSEGRGIYALLTLHDAGSHSPSALVSERMNKALQRPVLKFEVTQI